MITSYPGDYGLITLLYACISRLNVISRLIICEISIFGEGNNTYLRSIYDKNEIIETNVEYAKSLKMEVIEMEKDLPLM